MFDLPLQMCVGEVVDEFLRQFQADPRYVPTATAGRRPS
jgi:hypothetical protein